MPSVSLVDMVLCCFFVFCEQASAAAAANPVGEKSSERGTGSKGFFLLLEGSKRAQMLFLGGLLAPVPRVRAYKHNTTQSKIRRKMHLRRRDLKK